MQKIIPGIYRRTILLFLAHVGAFFAYVAIAKMGLLLATINNNASPVWPASGIAIVSVYLLGYRTGITIFLGAIAANWNTGLAPFSIGVIAFGNALEAVVGVYIFRALTSSSFFRIKVYSGVIKYFLLASLPTLLSATAGTIALSVLKQGNASAASTWITWWVGDCIGVLMVFPIFYEARELKLRSNILNLKNYRNLFFKIFIAAIFVYLSSHWVFAQPSGPSFLFVLFFAILTVAVMLPFLFVYIAAIFVSGYSIYMTQRGFGPFQSGATNDSLVHLELFLATVWLTCIVLAKLKRTRALRRPALALTIGWLMTGVAFHSFYQASTRRTAVLFETKVDEATIAITETMNGYVRLLEAGAGLLNASQNIKREQWYAFVDSLKLSERYPGIKGIGVIYAIENQDIKSFEKKWRKEFPAFRVHGLQSAALSHPNEKRFIISLIEPLDANRSALGLDISSEANRHRAALQAFATGKAVLSQKISLIQSKRGHGYLLLVPFHVAGGAQGFVYAPIESEAFFKSATKSFSNELDLVSYTPDFLGHRKIEKIYGDDLQTTVELAGNTHVLRWERTREAFNSTLPASLVGFCGAFCTLVLAILIASLEAIRLEAERIADQKTLEVEERERIWKTLTEISPVGIFLTNQAGEVIYVNKKWSNITGLSVYELKDIHFRELIHPDDRAATYEAWDQFSSGSKQEYVHEYRLNVHKQTRFIFSYVVPIKNTDKFLKGYLGIIQDITEQRQNQLALATAARMSSLGQMAGGVAHEINSPLAIISGRADLLKIALEDEKIDVSAANVHLDKIQATVQRIAKIIRGLRSIARDTSLEPNICFELRQAVQDALDLCESKFFSHGVKFCFEPMNDKMSVLGRPEQITQVLLNLLNNAFDAVIDQNEKLIIMTTYANAGSVFLEISDSGQGITEGDQRNLFNPFFTTKEVGHGTGLGLSISKAIIEKHGGKLSFDAHRKHTTFIVELPRLLNEKDSAI